MRWTITDTLAKRWWIGYLLTVLAVVCALTYLRYAKPTPPAYSPETMPVATANEPKVVTKVVVKKVLTPGPERIVYLPTPQVDEALPGAVSQDVAKDNNARILAVATIPPHSGDTTALAIMHTDGEGTATTRIDYRQMPPKFFQVKKEFGARAGISTGGVGIAELYARPLRVGPINVEVRGWVHAGQDTDAGGAVLLDYRF